MFCRCLLHAALVLSLASASASGQDVPAFDASGLVRLGDAVRYGSYEVIKIGDRIHQLKDSGDPRAQKGGLIGTDMYLIGGTTKALLVDLGNNYIDGYSGDAILPRKNAAEELRAVVNGLVGTLPLEIAITHAHPDHDGMTRAFLDTKTIIWMPEGEDLEATRKQHNIDPAVYTAFDHRTKTFDLGGGRVVKPLLVRGHSNGCTVYLLPSEMMLFTGDALGIGAGRSLRSAAQLNVWAEDTQKLVDYMKAHFTPYERYSLKVYTGHSVENPIPGFISPNHGRVDIAYLDWRFVQDQASCGNAILKGQWLVPDSGLRHMEVINSQSGRKVSILTYGIGAVEIPIQEAYAAAGLKVPE
jgi:glyoxylase-like metal-dependent hydrolase (beta-lactamase superfamily II)